MFRFIYILIIFCFMVKVMFFRIHGQSNVACIVFLRFFHLHHTLPIKKECQANQENIVQIELLLGNFNSMKSGFIFS